MTDTIPGCVGTTCLQKEAFVYTLPSEPLAMVCDEGADSTPTLPGGIPSSTSFSKNLLKGTAQTKKQTKIISQRHVSYKFYMEFIIIYIYYMILSS